MQITNYENKELNEKDIVVLGAPFDRNSSYKRGSALAPARIREALFCESSNMCTENRLDLSTIPGLHIWQDFQFLDDEKAFDQIESEIQKLLKRKLHIVTLGGDHSITLPVIRAYAKEYRKLNILHLDAHPDLYDELDGNRYSHACPFARIMEDCLAERLVQVGIRTLTIHQHQQAKRLGVEVIEMKNIESARTLLFDAPVYLSLDMDCLDPAYAPGVSHHEPGGMSTRDVIGLIQNLKGNLIGADIVEYNPARDLNGMTGMVAGKLLKEIIGKIYENTVRS